MLKLGLASGQGVPILDFQFIILISTILRDLKQSVITRVLLQEEKNAVHKEELEECEGA